jgi:hypothetical protein
MMFRTVAKKSWKWCASDFASISTKSWDTIAENMMTRERTCGAAKMSNGPVQVHSGSRCALCALKLKVIANG